MSNKILATVGNLTVTEADVNEDIEALGQRGAGYNTPDGRRAILSQLINHKLLLLDAQRNLYEGDPVFRAKLQKVKEELLIEFAAEKAIAGINVTDADIEKYYEENKDNFNTGATVNASHILVSTEEEANEILAKINGGEMSFEDAARKYSSCPSKENGGCLGEFTRGQMVPEFDSAVFAMEEGAISDAPVKTQFGYHLIKLNAKSDSKVLELSEIRDELYGMLINEKRRTAFESKVNQLKIMYPVDMAAF